MPIANSPLRYPGGKAVLSKFLADSVSTNCLQDGIYVEPFAGGAGAALNLLFGEHVQSVVLNDADPCIYAVWNAILNRKEDFIRRLRETPITIDEWKRQRGIYRNHERYSRIKVAIASFYLNRCNRSGIIVNGGPIGGLTQTGKWQLDARFNKDELIRRVEKIHLYRNRIAIYNMNAIDFLQNVVEQSEDQHKMLVYLDPPYYLKGGRLYLNHYQHADHEALSDFMSRHKAYVWLMTYDDVPEIRNLYRECFCIPFNLSYTAHTRKRGNELLIYDRNLTVPLESLSF